MDQCLTMSRGLRIKFLFKFIIFSVLILCFFYSYNEKYLKINQKLLVTRGLNESVSASTYFKEKLFLNDTENSRTLAKWPQTYKPKNQDENRESRFQLVDDIKETFVYSAFYDGRGNPVITVIVIVKADRLDEKLESDRYSCIADPSKKYLSASLEYITEPNWGYKYKGGFIRCNLTKTEKPKAISIVLHSQIKKNRNFTPKIKLTVQYPSKFLRNFTRCVPAFYNFTDQNALIQMLESDLMFGMNHFIMYNYTGMTPKIQQILKSYQDEGVLTLLQWNLPVLKKDIHYFGQMSNMHECILRNMYVSKYVFIADVDEIVVSDMFSSWQSMTSSILSKHPNCGAISFRNAFFPIIFKDGAVDFPGKTIARKMGLTFLLKTTRTKLHTIGDRSKLLVRPETIHQMGIHGVQKFLNSKMTTCPVNNPKDALLHHYRFKKASDMRSPYTDDHTFQKYSNELISRVQKRFQKIKTTSVT